MKKEIYSYSGFLRRIFIIIVITAFVCKPELNAQSYTIFDPPPVPSFSFPHDGGNPFAGIETGVRFRVARDGVINGIRFYQSGSDDGIHTGNLWTNAGVLVTGGSTATIAAESTPATPGWRDITFATPVSVTTGNIYVASVFSSTGYYNVDFGYFPVNATPVDPIYALGTSDDPGGNGLWLYTASTDFPTGDGGGVNYWVDVVFTPTFPLPVSLVSFKANTSGENNVVLTWETASEQNNKGFEIQRSNNGSDWYPVSFVNSEEESSVPKNYSFTDKELAPGNYYYRLNQQDHDGKSKLSSIVSATISGRGVVTLFPVYPNPIRGRGSIRFDLPVAQNIRLSIFDLYGREIKLLANKKGDKGSHLVNFTTEGLSKQLYYIRLQTENGILTKKIIIQ